ncbi:NAD(P)/FAD-dependent oxidoreductase [Legionella sp. km772]|uniref:FAD-dependent oxidoreductase n=1 Tax=Legionella sp. km772 TaxID=2498111 RepID=UPI000F8CAF40|nr:hypothetical protein [Legionella sp. km772]RUR13277.1 hypothetical protein ELY15_02785 [Legionella sp. km772]
MKPDVIFVGAGPVGLYTAIQAKLYNPALTILMLERDSEYKRTHVLNIDKKAHLGSHPDARLQEVLAQLEGLVPTLEIENRLKALAKSLGIHFNYEKVDHVDLLTQRYPSANTIIGADGAHSIVRREIFRDIKRDEKSMQYIIEVKYHSKKNTRKLNFLEYFQALTQINHLAVESVGKENNDATPVTLAFFTDKETYEALRALDVTSWKTMSFVELEQQTNPKISTIASSILSWMKYRHQHTQEVVLENSDKIAPVEFSTYRSESVVMDKNGRRFILIGDAAMSVPFFRAVNAGLKGGNYAAQLIADNAYQMQSQSDFFNRSRPAYRYTPKHYQQAFEAIAKNEISWAHHLNRLVNLGSFVIFSLQQSLRLLSLSMSMFYHGLVQMFHPLLNNDPQFDSTADRRTNKMLSLSSD